jgi:hypothetical protein
MSVLTPDGPNRPYNSDPKDQPAPETNFAQWLAAMVRYVEAEPGPAFTWEEIQEAARVETEARLIENSIQKNFESVDFMLDHPFEKFPDALLAQTQGHTAKTHPLEVESDAEYAARTKKKES